MTKTKYIVKRSGMDSENNFEKEFDSYSAAKSFFASQDGGRHTSWWDVYLKEVTDGESKTLESLTGGYH